MMKAMIFCAGLGTRLKPLTDTMPKALVPLAGKTLLQWQVEKLREAGIRDIVVNVHHFPDMIIDTIRRNAGWGCNIQISDERDLLLDTGGGLRKALSNDQLLTTNDPILACNVDILSNIDIRALIAQYEATGISQLVVSERQTQRYLLFDEDLTLRGWTNIATGEYKPSSLQGEGYSPIEGPVDVHRTSGGRLTKLAFSGMQILHPDIFPYLDQVAAEKGDKFSLIDLYLHIVQRPMTNQLQTTNHKPQTLRAYVPENYRMMDVGKIDQISEAERFAESL